MLRLLTLGGAAILDERVVAGAQSSVSQRRTLALLSVLAVCGRAGMSRDKLVAMFWPEADTERGRHALTQALYASRRALRCDDLFLADSDVRINPSRMTSDIAEFELALNTDDAKAASLYRGPFLDGFFLPGASEYERWVSTQRTRIEDHVVRALERLATHAGGDGDLRQAADWLRRAAAVRPLDSRIARNLMEALVAAGDPGGALQHASIHATLLREELDIEPNESVAELARSLRQSPTPRLRADAPLPVAVAEPAIALEGAPDGSRETLEIARAADRDAPSAEVFNATPSRHQAQKKWGWLRVAALFAVASVLVAAGFSMGRIRPESMTPSPPPLRQRLVVAPFRVVGAAPSLAFLREGIVELLSTRLADDSVARSIDAGAVLGAWHSAGLAPAVDVPRATIVSLASRLGAERVVVGGVVGTQQRLVLRATLLNVPAATVASQAMVEGSADSLTALVDRLAARLLVVEAGEDERLGNHTTTSLTALRAYLSGQAAFRRNDYSSALSEYEKALSADSSFALAALRAAVAADRVDDAVRAKAITALAWKFRTELSGRDQALLSSLAGSAYPAPTARADQVANWRQNADLAPRSAEAWFSFGERLFHDGATAGLRGTFETAANALSRALIADSLYVPAGELLVQLSANGIAGAAVSPTLHGLVLSDSTSAMAPFLRWREAIATGDVKAQRAVVNEMSDLSPAVLRVLALASQFDAVGLDDGARAIQLLKEKAGRNRSQLTDALLGEHALALNSGRTGGATQAITAMPPSLADPRATARLKILDEIFGNGDTSAAGEGARELEKRLAAAEADHRRDRSSNISDQCVLGQWYAAHGQWENVTPHIEWLRKPSAGAASGPGAVCAAFLDAEVAVTTRRPDARSRLAQLDSVVLTVRVVGDLAAYAPLWLAQLHERSGDIGGALDAVQRRQYMSDWSPYLAAMLGQQGRWAEMLGDRPTAVAAYRKYLALRAAPDSALQPQRDSVRAAVDRLSSSNSQVGRGGKQRLTSP